MSKQSLLIMPATKKIIFICIFLSSQLTYAGEKTLIRLGVLAFGTVNWELTAMQQSGMMETENYQLQVVKMANPQAGKIALLSGAVDMIVADWIWVSRQRSQGKGYTFYPYSNTTGALVVAKNSSIKQLQDLKDKKLAVAGGELDKNSLLLQALMQKQGQAKIFNSMEKVYGAPPLLSQQMTLQRVDALLTYWHYAARMEAEGYSVLMTGADILQGLGVQESVPSIGYVFDRLWADNNKAAVQAFLQNTQLTKDLLCTDKTAWQGIKSLTRAKTEEVNLLLRQKYCAGRILSWGEKEQLAAARVYQYLREISSKRLTGNAETIQSGTFW
ncbi:NitT/TauT family transport system substrate-binding protein [Bathymodiolus platifrons methanotrophic gill symbiont]|uniref:ABC transporter substrate-binding protein n=1 Tax=Bathymodiolus platifrons methanotrophic gill symbiont TaxID=113268 RepID=UPI000B679AB6|nr:ABC transporter substrate-binding protein [Bathymodiolus platifrons methanotrophic gill symbiont]GAW87126.1 NitT/TauT family transport system substrate-binding protein [Bathymodiolus platifrons methanotrophic gill symbiont]GFO75694.1 NitT/TauT family transport system substrate-binding protein [Bathymodiolus platifrons methanotrophic gill symbiont]